MADLYHKNKWSISYSNSVFNNNDGSPKEAPGWGIIDIIQFDNANQRPYHQASDYYIVRNGKFVGVDFAGMLDHVVNELGVVKVGRTINTKEYIRIRKQAEKNFINSCR